MFSPLCSTPTRACRSRQSCSSQQQKQQHRRPAKPSASAASTTTSPPLLRQVLHHTKNRNRRWRTQSRSANAESPGAREDKLPQSQTVREPRQTAKVRAPVPLSLGPSADLLTRSRTWPTEVPARSDEGPPSLETAPKPCPLSTSGAIFCRRDFDFQQQQQRNAEPQRSRESRVDQGGGGDRSPDAAHREAVVPSPRRDGTAAASRDSPRRSRGASLSLSLFPLSHIRRLTSKQTDTELTRRLGPADRHLGRVLPPPAPLPRSAREARRPPRARTLDPRTLETHQRARRVAR